MRTGRFHEEGWRIRQDGSRFWADVSITTLRDARGAVRGFAKVTRDMTERRDVEEALRASEERFRLLVDSVTDYAIVMLDPEGRIASWNAGAERIHGYSRAEALGRPVAMLYTAAERAAGKPEAHLAAAREGRVEDEGRRARKDGSEFWADVVIAAVRASDGTLRGYGCVTRDTTARRRAEEELRIYRLLVEGVRDYAIFMLDPRGHVRTWSPGAERLYGYSTEEIVGQHFSIFYPSGAVESGHPQRELQIAAAEGRYTEENWRVRKDGSRYWASVLITALRNADGKLTGFAKITRDFTERQRAEEEIRRLNAELAQEVADRTAALEELESFSYSVSHDLRAPLRGIDGFSKVLVEKYGQELDDQARHYLSRIRAGAQRMGVLIDDLLRLSRITRAELRSLPVDLGAMSREVIAELRKTEPERDVEVTIAAPLEARGDPSLLRVLLENLLGNAWKFTGKTAHARIEVGADTVAAPGERAFYVRDNGAGFEMQYADKLFTPFQRLHDASEFEGTGIGLATARRIVARHGGRIWAEGAPGRGATVWFTLGRSER
ncbi:MAG TPA: PAS domain S-box protein [Sandaracinaceae bacterium]